MVNSLKLRSTAQAEGSLIFYVCGPPTICDAAVEPGLPAAVSINATTPHLNHPLTA
jgi:hypothetical protein